MDYIQTSVKDRAKLEKEYYIFDYAWLEDGRIIRHEYLSQLIIEESVEEYDI